MHPILLDFGRFKLHSYGLMLFIAFFIGIIIAERRGRKLGLPDYAALDFSIAIIVSSLVGARFLYVITHLDEFHGRWLDIINPFQSDGTIGIAGLVLLGGVVLAIATLVFMAWLRNIPMLKILDVFTPSLALGIMFGRIGCFLNGCCFGIPTDASWGMIYPNSCLAGHVFPGVHIHPTQLYAIFYNLVIFIFLIVSERKWGGFHGYSTSVFLILYGIFRSLNETVRWYEDGMRLIDWGSGMITISQVISILMSLLGVVLFILARRSKINSKPVSSHVGAATSDVRSSS